MKDLFIQLCNFSVVTSIAIVIAIALRPVLKKGPSFIRCALWTLVFLRLLIPVEFLDMPFSLPKVFETEQTLVAPKDEGINEEIKEDVKEDVKEENNSVQQVPSPPVQPPIGGTLTETQRPVSKPVTDTPAIKEDAATENNGITESDSITANGTVAESQTTTQAETKLDIVKLISVIWAVGAALMLGYMLISNLILRYKIRGAVVYDNNIRILDKDCSPFVFGFFRPDIHIPASINKRDWGYIIAHESSHIKRLDHIVKPLAFTALCLYWYNPFVWAAYILFSKDIEYACDERTVKTMGSEDKKAYSMALLSVSQSSGRIFAPLSFGEVNVKERIKRVMRFKNSIWAVSLAAVICISLLIFIACTPDGDNKGLSSDTENSSSVEISVDSSDESSNTEENQPLLLISYADDKDASVLPYYIEDQDGMLIEIKANKTITDFTYVSIDSSTTMDILFETEELTADTPLYIKIRKDSWEDGRGVLYKDDTDNTVLARIVHNNTDGVDSLSFEIIPHGNSSMVDNDYFVVYVPDLTTQGPDGFNYITHMIDGEVDAETIVNHCIEEGLFPEGSAMQSFEIKDRVGYLDMNAMCYSLSTEYHEYIGLKAIEKTFLENYKTRIDKFVITYDGEERSNGSTGGETSYGYNEEYKVFNTENISSITFYSYSGNGVGSTVEDKYMADIINWLKTFTVGKRYPDGPVLPGTGHIVIEITYANGTVIKDTMDTVSVNGVLYYTDHSGYPDCYWEILSRTKLQPDHKITEKETNYALGKAYTITPEAVDADYAKYSYLGEASGDYTWCDYAFNKLTDGVVGDITSADYASAPFGISGITVMHAGTNRLFEYIIDLGDYYGDISSLVFRNVRIGGNSGFKVRAAYVSDDKETFTKVTGTTTEANANAANNDYFDCTFALGTAAKGRYVRIVLSTPNFYILQLEEIEIWNK